MRSPAQRVVGLCLAEGVTLSDGQEAVVSVQNGRSFSVDTASLALLHSLEGVGSSRQMRVPEPSGGILLSLARLEDAGLVEVEWDTFGRPVTSGQDRVAYSPELADLVVTRPVNWLLRVLSTCSAAVAPLWRRPLVFMLAASLPVLTVAAFVTVDAPLAYAEWLSRPWLVIALTLLVTTARTFAHEIGHVAASRRYHVMPRAAGIGFYLHCPVLYVDLTDIDTMGRRERSHCDLGGLAADAVVLATAFATVILWLPHSALASAVLLALVYSILLSLNPITKSDVNWFLRDVSGARDLPTSWGRPRELLAVAQGVEPSAHRRFARFMLLSLILLALLLLLTVPGAIASAVPTIGQLVSSPARAVPALVSIATVVIGWTLIVRSLQRSTELEGGSV